MSASPEPQDIDDSLLERSALSSFGTAIVEFEATLFQKFLHISSRHSLTTLEGFRKLLARMQAKGYVAPLELHGNRAWKRLVVEDRIEDVLIPRKIRQLEEAQRAFVAGYEIPGRTGDRVVSESKAIAEDILRTMRAKLFAGKPTDEASLRLMLKHVENMRKALTASRRELEEYLNTQAPSLKREMEHLLDAKGEDMILLSLRLIETG
ncbi:MAG: hypothetical protein HXY34_11930 [Candidatus Thorarchaeota archaeon]|nr:hypothetical protein [Candidatus Thorarchaeota archaeon]